MSNDHYDDSYQSISCADYSNYELWIMRNQSLIAAWKKANGQECIANLQPLDLQTRNKQEFLIARLPQGDRVEIRLDHIISCKPVTS